MSEKKEEYKGPGRYVTMVGRGSVEGGLGGLAGAGVGAAIGAAVGAVTHNAELAEKFGMSTAHLGAAGGAVGGAVLGFAAGDLHGSVKGWKSASAGKAQFEDQQSQLDKLKARDELRSTVSEATRGGR